MEALKLQSPDRKLTLEYILPEMVRTGFIDKAAAEAILKQSAGSKDYPLLVISKFGLKDRRSPFLPLSLEALMEWLARLVAKPYFEIDPLKMDIKAVTALLSTAYVRRLQVIPVKVDKDKVQIATSEPFALSWVQELESLTRRKIEVVVSSPVSIRYFLEEFFTVRQATQEFNKDKVASKDFGQVIELDQMLGKIKRNEFGKDAAAVVRIVDWLFQFACTERATDIHMEPKMGKGQVRFRIDGKMRIVYNFEPELMQPVLARIKILAEMQVDEKRKPQDGRLRYKLSDNREMEMRLSTIPIQHGEKLVVRIFDPKMAGKSFQDLGFAAADIARWEGLINLPHGMVLVTGPTGSGKSTTLHTSMRMIAKDDVNICTVEDPVEIMNEDLNQMQVNSKLDISFGSAIRAFLRQDPDIIMVGEIRDADAGKMAIQAALTGHLVLTTLHTNDAVSSITRLIDLGIPPHLITASLRGMMAQRLVRRLCDFCKEKIPTSPDSWSDVIGHHKIPAPEFVFGPTGCRECKHSGYMGRICVYEMLVMGREMREVVKKNVTLEELMTVAEGRYVPLRVCGARKISEGVTSIEEVLRVIY